MSESLSCFRCGTSLDQLSLPLSRRDECPKCSIHLHVCMMCRFFDAQAPKQCREDDAEEVFEKEKANFCEWFKPSAKAFDPVRGQEAADAESTLATLFSDEPESKSAAEDPLKDAEDLFKS